MAGNVLPLLKWSLTSHMLEPSGTGTVIHITDASLATYIMLCDTMYSDVM